MGWVTAAQTLLDAAVDAGPPVAREFIAPGPRFAHDCSLIAVHVADAGTEPPGGLQLLSGDRGCVLVPYTVLMVTFVLDCVPSGEDVGGEWQPPAAADVTAWSATYLSGAEAIWQAVMDAAAGPLAEECLEATVGDVEFGGPLGGVAWSEIPVRVQWAA